MTLWPENPRLEELLADSIVQAAMRADGVKPETVKTLMNTMARRIAVRRGGFLLPKPVSVATPVSRPHDALPGSVEQKTPFFPGALAAAKGPRGACDFPSCW